MPELHAQTFEGGNATLKKFTKMEKEKFDPSLVCDPEYIEHLQSFWGDVDCGTCSYVTRDLMIGLQKHTPPLQRTRCV